MDTPEPVDNANPLPETDALLEELRREAQRESRRAKFRLRMALLFLIVAGTNVLCFTTLSNHYALYEQVQLLSWLSFLLGVALIAVSSVITDIRKKNRFQLIRKLRDDVRIAGPLVEFIYEGQIEELNHLVAITLTQILPRVQSSDSRYFTEGQMTSLLELLPSQRGSFLFRVKTDTGLVIAILKALEQIGDKRAVEPVQRLMAKSKDVQIQQAAQECLPFLQQRAAVQDQTETLLRPSSAVSDAPETLLRPAAAGETTEGQEQLLRPVE